MTGALRRLSPWSPVESRRMLLLVVVGLVLVVVAWWLTAREAQWNEQTDAMLLAVLGGIVAAYGVTSWLLRARAVCAARRRVMFGVLGDVGPARGAPTVPATAVEAPAAVVVAHPDRGRYHRPECDLAAAEWPAFGRADPDINLNGREPCGVCRP